MKALPVLFLSVWTAIPAFCQEEQGGMRFQLSVGLTAFAEETFQGVQRSRLAPDLDFGFETTTRLQSFKLGFKGTEIGQRSEQRDLSGHYSLNGPARRLSFDIRNRRIGQEAFVEEDLNGASPNLTELSDGARLRIHDTHGAFEFGIGRPLQGVFRLGRQTRTGDVSNKRHYMQFEAITVSNEADQLGIKLKNRWFETASGEARQRREQRVALTFAKRLTVTTAIKSALGYAQISDFGREVGSGFEGDFWLSREYSDGQVFLSGEVSRFADGRILTALVGGRGAFGALEASGQIGITRLDHGGNDLAFAVAVERSMPRAKMKFGFEQGLRQSANTDDTQLRATVFGQYQYTLDPLSRLELSVGYSSDQAPQGAEKQYVGQLRTQYVTQIGRNWGLKAGVQTQQRRPLNAERDESVRVFLTLERLFEGVL